MTKRVISAIVALLILVPIILKGGWIFNLVAYIIALLGLKEFMDAKSKKKQVPFVIGLMAYIFISLIILVDVTSSSTLFSLDYRVIAALFIAFLLPVVLYHDQKKYSITDAFYLLGGVLFLGISMALLIMLRYIDLKIFVFLFTITITTDVFAYLTGMLIGKHKLLSEISPKKTIEGLIGGTIMGVFVSSMFYLTCIDSNISIALLIFSCTFLSLLGQFGDLIFSAMKRHFEIKDFSNIMPGHGGVLDRLDSIIFVVLGFIFFINIL
ncbi:MAG: phosphatidate cytidylyltransferase [Bacilli bacterium]|nr:phosphatidate cytidylyltransferase [Bacilli bacterium]